jgi:hypothetical protein
MKRRGFVKGLLVTPVVAPMVPLVSAHEVADQAAAPAVNPTLPPRPSPPGKLATVQVDLAAETSQRFFKPEQFAALERLGEILVPPMQGKPGAAQAGAALFLDFLISESPRERQRVYQHGLDGLNLAAHKRFNKPFAGLDAGQADSILKPLLVARPWAQDMPEDPMQHFIAQAHQDLRTATSNSREWAQASISTTGGRRGFNQAAGLYWNPIDPVVKG